MKCCVCGAELTASEMGPGNRGGVLRPATEFERVRFKLNKGAVISDDAQACNKCLDEINDEEGPVIA